MSLPSASSTLSFSPPSSVLFEQWTWWGTVSPAKCTQWTSSFHRSLRASSSWHCSALKNKLYGVGQALGCQQPVGEVPDVRRFLSFIQILSYNCFQELVSHLYTQTFSHSGCLLQSHSVGTSCEASERKLSKLSSGAQEASLAPDDRAHVSLSKQLHGVSHPRVFQASLPIG